jgi:hypothetical protein
MEGRNPLGAVLSPQQYSVAGSDPALDQQCGKTAGQVCNLAVRSDSAPIALVSHYRHFAAVAAEVVEKRCQVVAHGSFGENQLVRCWTGDSGPNKNTIASGI